MTPERSRQLKRIYRRAIVNANAKETREAWMRYLAALYKEDGNLTLFFEIRGPARDAGATLDEAFLRGEITARQLFHQIRVRCADRYANELTACGVADIDIESDTYKTLTRRAGIEVLQAFDGTDAKDKTAVCVAMAMTWNRLVQLLHREYGLPTVRALRSRIKPASDAEETVLDGDDFETKMTRAERTRWEETVDAVVR